MSMLMPGRSRAIALRGVGRFSCLPLWRWRMRGTRLSTEQKLSRESVGQVYDVTDAVHLTISTKRPNDLDPHNQVIEVPRLNAPGYRTPTSIEYQARKPMLPVAKLKFSSTASSSVPHSAMIRDAQAPNSAESSAI